MSPFLISIFRKPVDFEPQAEARIDKVFIKGNSNIAAVSAQAVLLKTLW
jgi:hypothetical protein